MYFPTSWANFPGVVVSSGMKVIHDSDSKTAVSVTANKCIPTIPLSGQNSRNCELYYWEVEVLECIEVNDIPEYASPEVVIGLISPDSINAESSLLLESMPGVAVNSVGLSSSGLIRSTEINARENPVQIEITSRTKFGQHDIVGCGLEVTGMRRIFFTINGRLIDTGPLKTFTVEHPLLPVVSLVGPGTAVLANFGTKPFQFDTGSWKVINQGLSRETLPQVPAHNGYYDPDYEALHVATVMSLKDTIPRNQPWSSWDTDAADRSIRIVNKLIANRQDSLADTLSRSYSRGHHHQSKAYCRLH